MKESKGEVIFNIFNNVILGLIAFLTLYPFIYVLSGSISNPYRVAMGDVLLLPKGFELAAYEKIFSRADIWLAYRNTIIITVLGTIIGLFFQTTGSYALSKKRLLGRKYMVLFVLFTMWFSAGVIPTYLNLRMLRLTNSFLSVTLPFTVSAFHTILMINFFRSIPEEIEESAKIDGANDIYIYWKLYLPLSVPAVATIALYIAVSRWNTYLWPMILLRDKNKITLAVYLKKMLVDMVVRDEIASQQYDPGEENINEQTIIYATIAVSIIPIVLVYPFIQRYFVKGIMVGSVKG